MTMRKAFAIMLTFIMVLGVFPIAHADSEIPDGYTPIYTAEDLSNIRNDLYGKYILMNDIDLSVYKNWEPIGSSEEPFTGELNGNGYIIKNLKINALCTERKSYIGLFGVAKDSSFSKITIVDGNISAISDECSDSLKFNIAVGMIAAKIVGKDSTIITNCCASGKINVTGFNSALTGGLFGVALKNNYIYSSSSYVDISVITKDYMQNIYVGGLLGGVSENNSLASESYVRIEKSSNFGDLSLNNKVCSDETRFWVGGIVSFQINGNELSECYNRGNISISNSTGTIFAGGITGRACSRVELSYSSGLINAVSDEDDAICNLCYVEDTGGLAIVKPTFPTDYIVYNCYSIIGNIEPCKEDPQDYSVWYKTILLTEDEFKKQESFSKFDFENTWEMEEDGYPVLKNQPKVTVKTIVELKVGEKHPIKEGRDYIIHSDSPLSIDYITAPENNEISAIHAGQVKLTIIYDYCYTAEYDITITESISIDPIVPDPVPEPLPNDNCWFENLWIVKTINKIFNMICSVFIRIISLF